MGFGVSPIWQAGGIPGLPGGGRPTAFSGLLPPFAAYVAAKKAARLAKAKGAHDELIAKAHRAQADALEIEALAKRQLADEYDAARERGEVGKRGEFGGVTSRGEDTPTVSDIGLTHKAIYEARQIRDAEEADPSARSARCSRTWRCRAGSWKARQ